jgi:poly(hydroxyalkanoate) depolymerase family esterase
MKRIARTLAAWLRRALAAVRRLWRKPLPSVPTDGRFDAGVLLAASGPRAYKLFIPGRRGRAMPLVVMLHGCTQDPDDFARGTRMNQLADERGFLVLYPAQPARSNAAKCWNWFLPGDQRRDAGEPAIIAGMVRQVAQQHPVDAERIYVAGLSAGAAMAAILASEYADLFAAAGVHSGLPPGAAEDVASAFAVMHTGRLRPGPRRPAPARPSRPTIVFHGDNDKTVHPVNGQHVVDHTLAGVSAARSMQRGEAGGRHYTHTVYEAADGTPLVEHWEVHGAGHGWSGGDPAGSFTETAGPDASREFIRFFERHRRARPAR